MAAGDDMSQGRSVGGVPSIFASYVGPPKVDRRERIATAALQGMLADSKWLVACKEESDRSGVATRRIMAESAVQYADALIAELDKGSE